MALDLARCYLTATDCSEVVARTQRAPTSSTYPTLTQVEGYVYDIAAILEGLTQRAGALYSPPVAGVSPSYLARKLTAANAAGAAYLQWLAIMDGNGDERTQRILQRLAGEFQTYVGEGAINVGAGLASIQYGNGGLIEIDIQSVSGSQEHASDASEGLVILAEPTIETVEPPFRMRVVD